MLIPYNEVMAALRDLAYEVDVDCPQEYRSEHLKSALDEAFRIVENFYKEEVS